MKLKELTEKIPSSRKLLYGATNAALALSLLTGCAMTTKAEGLKTPNIPQVKPIPETDCSRKTIIEGVTTPKPIRTELATLRVYPSGERSARVLLAIEPGVLQLRDTVLEWSGPPIDITAVSVPNFRNSQTPGVAIRYGFYKENDVAPVKRNNQAENQESQLTIPVIKPSVGCNTIETEFINGAAKGTKVNGIEIKVLAPGIAA